MSDRPHSVNVPSTIEKFPARFLVKDATAFTNGTPVEFVVNVAGAVNAYVRVNTVTSGGALAIRGRRTNGDEYPVGFTVADTAIVAGTPQQITCPVRGMKEIVVRFTPSGNGTFDYLDIGFQNV